MFNLDPSDMKEYLLYMLIMKLLEMKESKHPEEEAPLMFGRRSSTPQVPMGLNSMGGMSD